MKVLHVETGMHLYGGALQVYYLLQGLHRRRVESVLVCPRGSGIADAAREYAEVVETPCGGELDIRFGAQLALQVRQQRPDLLHVHSRRGADFWGSLVARRLRQPSLLTRRVDNPEPTWLARWKYQPFQQVVTISQGIREVLVKAGIPSGKVVCIRSALDAGPYQQPADPAWFQAEFDLPEQAPTIGVIAQLIPRKGHKVLIEAAPRILEACPRAQFLFFGQGAERSRLEAQCRQAGLADRVHFAGFREDLPRILPNLDLVVHPASMEGLGIALLQASAASVPIVATQVGGIPEAVRDGINGILVRPGDAAELGRQVAVLLLDPERRTQLGREGRKLVEEEFSVERMVEENLALYRQVLGFEGGEAV